MMLLIHANGVSVYCCRFDYPGMSAVNESLTGLLFFRQTNHSELQCLNEILLIIMNFKYHFNSSSTSSTSSCFKLQNSVFILWITISAFLFHCSFFIIVFFILLNMIMAVIMGSYEEAQKHSFAAGFVWFIPFEMNQHFISAVSFDLYSSNHLSHCETLFPITSWDSFSIRCQKNCRSVQSLKSLGHVYCAKSWSDGFALLGRCGTNVTLTLWVHVFPLMLNTVPSMKADFIADFC